MQLIIYIIFCLFLISIVNLTFGFLLGISGVFLLSFGSVLLNFICFLIYFEWIIEGSIFIYKSFIWLKFPFFLLTWGFLIDSLSILMLLIISIISLLVHYYSFEYLKYDPFLNKFIAYLSLFTFFMFLLVTADNLLQLFLGWEGVGLCSYLLIGFWYTRVSANKAAIKALVINRIGDIFLLMGIAVIFEYFQTLEFTLLCTLISYYYKIYITIFCYSLDLLTLIGILLFLGAIGKSAQFGLHTWLADAMEGPTPVSALIHAATMVTAGVFLLIRCSFLFEYTPTLLLFIALIGSLTAFFAGLMGLFQFDIKKIIAFSTCSQLGYMILACGLSNYIFAFYHLITHAFFKALLFLCSGSIIHCVSDEQDFRYMGGLRYFLPVTYSAMVIGSFTIMGFPFLSSYYSKDLIIEGLLIDNVAFAYFISFIILSSVACTIIYSIRLLYGIFLFIPKKVRKVDYVLLNEGSIFTSKILQSLIILSFFSVFIGYFLQDLFTIIGLQYFNNTIFGLRNEFLFEFNSIFSMKIFFLVLFTILLFYCIFYLISYCIFTFYFYLYLKFYKFYVFNSLKWFVDIVQNKYICWFTFNLGYLCFICLEKGYLEIFGPYGALYLSELFSKNLIKFYSNRLNIVLYYYLLFIFFCFFIFL